MDIGNAFTHLLNREVGKSNRQKDLRCLSRIVEQPTRTYKLKWSKWSKQDIVFINHLYFENYSYAIDFDGAPLFNIKQRNKSIPNIRSRFMEMIGFELCLNKFVEIPNELITITQSGHLMRFNLETAEHIATIRLSKTHKFRYMSWDQPQETFYLTSTKQQGGDLACIVFGVAPFQLIAKFVVRKSIFGKQVRQISVWESCLVVASQLCAKKKTFQLCFYSLQQLMQEFTIAEPSLVDLNDPTLTEIPDTLDINRLPCEACVFKVDSFDVDFGGVPISFVHSDYSKQQNSHNAFLVSDLRTRTVLGGGRLSFDDAMPDATHSLNFYDRHHRLALRHSQFISVYSIAKDSLPPCHDSQNNKQPIIIDGSVDRIADDNNNNNSYNYNITASYGNNNNNHANMGNTDEFDENNSSNNNNNIGTSDINNSKSNNSKLTHAVAWLKKEFTISVNDPYRSGTVSNNNNNNNNSSSSSSKRQQGSAAAAADTKKSKGKKAMTSNSKGPPASSSSSPLSHYCGEATDAKEEDARGVVQLMSSRGRKVVMPRNYFAKENICSEIIHAYDYDDEMDVLAVLMKGHVYMYRNSTGEFIRKVRLEYYNEDWTTQSIYMDRNYLLHLGKEDRGGRSNNNGNDDDDEDASDDDEDEDDRGVAQRRRGRGRGRGRGGGSSQQCFCHVYRLTEEDDDENE